jgi:hypothetical protein
MNFFTATALLAMCLASALAGGVPVPSERRAEAAAAAPVAGTPQSKLLWLVCVPCPGHSPPDAPSSRVPAD